jgi:NAD-dependent deacetylase
MNAYDASLMQHAVDILKKSSYTVAFTGAGISTPSGIPDFRSPGSGLWDRYDPFAVASLSAFRHAPERFFDWIKPLYLQSRDAAPNAAHLALAELESRGKVHCVITQNIDGLHQKAGSKNVAALHGSAQTATCPGCRQTYNGEELLEVYVETDVLPACPRCGKTIKPDVILFGEPLPAQVWQQAELAILKADAVLVIGSSLEVSPANTLPESGAAHGAALIINTISATHLDYMADVVIQADVTTVIPAIRDLLLH